MRKIISDIETNVSESPDVAERIACQTVAEREAGYAAEIRGLLDAGRAVIRRFGTTASPRVADIVQEAGVSNGVFYRHFQGKDELVTALLDDGTARMRDHLVRQLATSDDPAEQVRRWVAGVLTPATRPESADEIRSVLWNGARVSDDSRRRVAARESLAGTVHATLAALGSHDPDADAMLVVHVVFSRLEEYLWRRHTPAPDDIEHLSTFCLQAVTPAPADRPHPLSDPIH